MRISGLRQAWIGLAKFPEKSLIFRVAALQLAVVHIFVILPDVIERIRRVPRDLLVWMFGVDHRIVHQLALRHRPRIRRFPDVVPCQLHLTDAYAKGLLI